MHIFDFTFHVHHHHDYYFYYSLTKIYTLENQLVTKKSLAYLENAELRKIIPILLQLLLMVKNYENDGRNH